MGKMATCCARHRTRPVANGLSIRVGTRVSETALACDLGTGRVSTRQWCISYCAGRDSSSTSRASQSAIGTLCRITIPVTSYWGSSTAGAAMHHSRSNRLKSSHNLEILAMFDRVSRFVARHRWQQFIWSVALLACALGAPFFTGGTGGAPADSSSTLHAQPPATRPKQVFRRPVARAALANEPVEPESKRLLSTAQLQEQIDAALGAEIPPLQSPVLVLPVTGSDGKVRHDGLGIAAQVLEAISDGRQDRAFPAPGRTLEVLVNSECWRPGSEISVRLANACLKSIDASLAVACSLSSTAAGHKLEIRFWREAGQTDGEVVSRNIRPGRLNTVPGLIALEILSRTGVLLSNAEMNNIREPQVSGDEGATVLGEFLTGVASPGAKLARLRAFLDHNPRCHRGWKLLLNHGGALPLTPSGPDAAPAIRFNPVGLQLTAIPNLLDAG